MQQSTLVDGRFLATGEEAGTAPGDRRFRPDVEGLRAVAVLLVVLFHAGVPHLTGGYVGVDVFFVISGFVITGLLLRERQGTGRTSILDFYARRCRRILPAATLVILVTVVFSYLLLGAVSGSYAADDGRWAAVFLANFHFEWVGTNYFTAARPPSPLQNYWSLSVEEQFYVVYPTLLLLVAGAKGRLSLRARLSITLGLVIGGSYWFSIVQTASHPTQAYFSPFTRAWELALGALVAVCTPWLKQLHGQLSGILTWAGLAAIVASAFAFNAQTAYPGSLVAIPVVGAALIIAGGSSVPRGGAEALLATGPFQWMGRRSYSLYLWHWPVLIIAAERVGKTTLPVGENLLLVAFAVVLSALTYVVVENPIRHWRLPSNKSVAGGIGLIVTTVVVLSLLIAGQSTDATAGVNAPVVPAPNAQVLAAQVAAAVRITSVPQNVQPSLTEAARDTVLITNLQSPYCAAYVGQAKQPICMLGDVNSTRLMVVYGDSHASMWLPALDSIALQTHWKLVVLSKLYCPAELVTVVNPSGWQRPNGPYAACDQWHQWVIRWINKHHPDMLVVSQENGGFYRTPSSNGGPPQAFSGAQWRQGLVALFNAIHVPAIQKIDLGDIPFMSTFVPACLSQNSAGVQACSTPATSALSSFGPSEQEASREAGARYVDPTPWFCSSVCTALIGKYIVYWDPSHVTETYAKYVRVVLGRALGLP